MDASSPRPVRPAEPARPTRVRTEDVRFPKTTPAFWITALQGTIHLPEGPSGPRPAVILIHGSGPTDRNARAPGELVAHYDEPLPLFEALADYLSKQGLVVLRYDKRACHRCYEDLHAVGHGLTNLRSPTDPPRVDPAILTVLDTFLATVGNPTKPRQERPFER